MCWRKKDMTDVTDLLMGLPLALLFLAMDTVPPPSRWRRALGLT